MNSQLTAYIALICTSGVLNLYLCAYVFNKRYNYSNVSKYFILYTGFTMIYCFGSAFGLTASTIEQIEFWNIITYVGLPFCPPLGLLFIMQYLGFKIEKKRIFTLLIIPTISFIMVASNNLHHLHYKVFEIDSTQGAPFYNMEVGFWYVVHGIFTFGSMFVAFLLLLSRWKEIEKAYRPQLIALMVGQLVPMVTSFCYLEGWTPPGIDPVPMVIWITSLLYLWSINSSRLFTIMPIAKDAIFNSIRDGVIVLDESSRLIEFNQACNRMFQKLNKSMFGMDFEKVWYELSDVPFPFDLGTVEVIQELTIQKLVYQVRTSTIQHANHSQGQLIIFTDITELKELQVKLTHQAYYDELTQVYNRRAFFQQCEKSFDEAKRTSLPYTVIMFDIDYFKKVNDTYGHRAGDELLKHVAKVCQTELKGEVLFARYGGEEFVLALKGWTLSEGEVLANHLRESIESQKLVTSDGAMISVTSSFGVSQAIKDDETLTQLLNKADEALYSAKHDGRNRVNVYIAEQELLK